MDLDFIGGVLWENWEGKRRNVGLGDNIIITLRASQAREQRQKHRDGQTCTTPKRKGYIPRITASRYFIGRASLVISLARSISLQSGTRER